MARIPRLEQVQGFAAPDLPDKYPVRPGAQAHPQQLFHANLRFFVGSHDDRVLCLALDLIGVASENGI